MPPSPTSVPPADAEYTPSAALTSNQRTAAEGAFTVSEARARTGVLPDPARRAAAVTRFGGRPDTAAAPGSRSPHGSGTGARHWVGFHLPHAVARQGAHVKKPSWRDVAGAVTSKACAAKGAVVDRAAALPSREDVKSAVGKAVQKASTSARSALGAGRAAVGTGAASVASGARAVAAGVDAAARRGKAFAKDHPELVEGAVDLAIDLMPAGRPAASVARFAVRAAKSRLLAKVREEAQAEPAPAPRPGPARALPEPKD